MNAGLADNLQIANALPNCDTQGVGVNEYTTGAKLEGYGPGNVRVHIEACAH